MGTFRWVVQVFFGKVVRLYFRELEVVGDLPDASTHGRIFAANHVNGLVDPILVMTSLSCVVSPVAKSTLWKIPGLSWLLDAVEAVPVLRRRDDPHKPAAANDQVFTVVAERLSAGTNILIFPEGTSHNEPHLVPLKTGAGRMLATARSRGARDLTFQAVGLEFDARDTFRSRALVLFGPVRRVEEFAEGTDGDGNVDGMARAITEKLREDLSSLVLETSTWRDRWLVARAAELLANEEGDHRLSGAAALGRAIEEAKKLLLDEDRALVEAVEQALVHYFTLLERAELKDADVARMGGHPAPGATFGGGIVLLLLLPVAVVGALLYALPYPLPRWVAHLAGKEHDIRSTYKILTGIVVYPAWVALLGGLCLGLLPMPIALGALALVLGSPFAALRWLDVLDHQRRIFPRSARAEEAHWSTVGAARKEARDQLEKARQRWQSLETRGKVPQAVSG